MKRKKHASRRGALPGKIVHVGEILKDEVLLTCVNMKESGPTLERVDLKGAIEYIEEDSDAIRWLIVEGLHDVGALKMLSNALGLESIMSEKIANAYERPGLREYGDHELATLRYVRFETTALESEQITLIRKGNVVISIFEDGLQSMPGFMTRLNESDQRVLTLGASYLFYSLMDAVLDGYYMALENMTERMESLESAIIAGPDKSHLTELQIQRKELSEVHRYLRPFKDALASYVMLDRIIESKSVLTAYYMDLLEQATHLEEMVDHYREALSDLLELYLSSANKHQSDTMQFLALVSTIYLPLTFIVGVYGMNFKYMPELEFTWSYPAVMVFLFMIAVGHYIWFKRKRWL